MLTRERVKVSHAGTISPYGASAPRLVSPARRAKLIKLDGSMRNDRGPSCALMMSRDQKINVLL